MLYVDFRKRLNSYELHVKLEAEDGILGMFGSSGAGKSMTLKCIAGIEKPDSGVIRLNGKTLYDSEHHVYLKPQERGVGYLFQDYALFPNMTVKQNILTGLHRLPRNERGAKAAELMAQFRVDHLSDKRPARLSGGERQRTALARLFASSPDLILLDEPFSSLDTVLKCELIPLMKDAITAYGKGCLMVSHDATELSVMCDRITTITEGKNSSPITALDFKQRIDEQYEKLANLTNTPQPLTDSIRGVENAAGCQDES